MSEIRRVLIWSGWLRLSHWAVALSIIVLMVSGWLIAHSPMMALIALEYHYLAASVLVFGLVVRAALFIRGQPHEQLSALFPGGSDINGIKQTLTSYLSMARQPLPNWYAHNPLWKMIHVFLYIILLLMILSGMNYEENPVLLGFYMPSVHKYWADLVWWYVMLHLLALGVHDYYAKTTDMSAMVNGYRLFEVEKQQKPTPGGVAVSIQPIDDLLKNRKTGSEEKRQP